MKFRLIASGLAVAILFVLYVAVQPHGDQPVQDSPPTASTDSSSGSGSYTGIGK